MRLEQLRAAILPSRQHLLAHPLYQDLRGLPALRTFMEYHVFAVWDFMSLLKALQQRLCCNSVPWLPAEPSVGARLINEIVVAEETDDDARGGFASHFDLYRRSMWQLGADTRPIDELIDRLRGGLSVREAMRAAGLPAAVEQFVGHTFDVIESGDVCRIASTLTFGREDLLPAVFQRIVDEMRSEAGDNLDDFRYYLLRHVELDGDEHGPMAARLVEGLCGTDDVRWQVATQAALDALAARLDFWNAIHCQITAPTASAKSVEHRSSGACSGPVSGTRA